MKLCYVKNNFAYFTDNFEKQWGDDWNDIPYEINAGPPSTHYGNVEMVAFLSNFEDPSERPDTNYNYSVEQINKQKIPWLAGLCYKSNSYKEILPGTSKDEFIQLILESDGKIFLEKE